MKNKILALLVILLSAIRPAAAETITHDISTGPIKITEGGSYVVTGDNNWTDANTITIDVEDGETVDLTLRDIDLQTNQTHPIEIKKGTVKLTLEGSNELYSYYKSAVQVSAAGSLTIDGTGYLGIATYDHKLSFGDEDNPDTETDVTIHGGTIRVEDSKSAPLSITGGSVKGDFTEKTGKRCVTVTPINQEGSLINKSIATISQPEGYGCLGIRTDNASKLYLWLTEREQTISLTMEGDEQELTGSLNVGESNNSLTITPEGFHEVSYSSVFNSSLKGFPFCAKAGETATFSIEYEYQTQTKGILAVTAEGVNDLRPTGKPNQYTFSMPDRDVVIRLKETDLQVITDVEDGTELKELAGRNELVIKEGGAYTITNYGYKATSSIRIADDVTGDVS
ncbi:carbohydrate-binding domain-containing protein, partial [Parabacteroides sp.]